MGKIYHFEGFSVVEGGIKAELNLDRFSKQFQQAQYELDKNISKSIQRFMPRRTGRFIIDTGRQSKPLRGMGVVVGGTGPMGRFLYMGKLMVDPVTGSPWARKGAKKVVTDTPLKYNQASNSNAGPDWFPRAKAADGEKWIKQCKRTAGGGKR